MEKNLVDCIIKFIDESSLKESILFLLYKNTKKEYKISEIADAIGSDISNVSGALKGDGKRYRKDKSLIALGLVDHHKKIINNRMVTVYKINDLGIAVMQEQKKTN